MSPPARAGALTLRGGDDGLDEAFSGLSRLMYEASGVRLTDQKKGLVRARLSRRLRALELEGYGDYLERIRDGRDAAELATMVDLLTTNKTSFFREAAHFEYLRDEVAPGLATRGRARVWSAGCSTGEEAWTLAAVLDQALPRDFDVKILATDISGRVVREARDGVYPANRLEAVPARYRDALLERRPEPDGRRRVRDDLRRKVTFARLNLLGSWPMRGPFDAIFCRNVMIYFDAPTRQGLVRRFGELLGPGGHLFVGHSESLHALDHGLRYVRPAVYVR